MQLLGEQNRVLRAELRAQYDFSRIVGYAPKMVAALKLVADVAPSEATVLITGPPGTGKELIAHALHPQQRAAARPFVKVHVGGLPESLFEERELFVHVRGAPPTRAKIGGRFDVADGGTLFLDEIGTLGPAQRVRLLRVLQEGEFQALGSTRAKKVDDARHHRHQRRPEERDRGRKISRRSLLSLERGPRCACRR